MFDNKPPKPLYSPFWKRVRIQDSTFLVFICTLVAVVLSWNLFDHSIFRTASIQSQDALNENREDNVSTTETNNRVRWKSNTANISFDIPDGWFETTQTQNSFPYPYSGYSDFIFVLENNSNACVIFGTNAEWDGEITSKFISFGDRVFGADNNQFDSRWAIPSTTENAKYSFTWQRKDVRQYIPGEFRSTGVSYIGGDQPYSYIEFVLFTSDGTAVPDQCNRDFNILLESSEAYYEPIQLTQESKGTMFLETIRSRGVYESLIFIPDGSNEKFEVARPPETGRGFKSFGNKVLGNKIYRSGDGGVYSYDPFTDEFARIFEEADRILSLFIYRGNFYYTTAFTCPENWRDCPSSLYTVPVSGGIPTLVATTTVGPHIQGYAEEEGAWYITGGYSDAGCGSLNISKIVANAEQSVQRFDGCINLGMEGDQVITTETPERTRMEIAGSELEQKVGGAYATTTAIRVENGKLSPSSVTDLSGRIIYFAKP